MPLEGTRLGHYRLLRQIGGGGMSDVYLAQDLKLQGRQVAIKLVRAEVAPYPDSDLGRDSGKLFHREARAIALLDRHPHILPLYEFGEEPVHGGTVTYLVMPYCPDGSLVTWLKQRSISTNAFLSPQEVEFIISQAADALQYAHSQHIIHRDVKLSNFLIQRLTKANLPCIQLADFGIARINTGTSNMSQNVRGTVTYMPPEQWQGHPVPATDQYALAIMAYELLTGRPPFQGDVGHLMYLHTMEKPQPPSAFNPNLSPDIDTVILQALEKDPAQRFKSISAFATAFQQAVHGDAGARIPSTPLPPPKTQTAYLVSQFSETAYPIPPGGKINSGTAYAVPPVAGGNSASGTAYPGPSSYAQTQPAPFTPPPPPPKQPWYRARITLIASIALVLLLVLSGVIYTVTSTPKNNSPPDATATAKVNNAIATFQAHAKATVTAHGNATSTAIAQATASVIAANPDPYPPRTGRIALLDPLTGDSSHASWSSISGCFFANGGYHSSVNQSGAFNLCYLTNSSFSNFTIQVDMTVIKGDCGGIIFRANSFNGKQYLFRVCQDNQRYYLYNCSGFTVCQELTNRTSFEIHAGLGQNNRIAIVANGSRIDLYINSTNVDSITHTAYTSGSIGLSASTLNNRTEVVFQNLKVWTF